MATTPTTVTAKAALWERLRPAHMGDFLFQSVTFATASLVLVLILAMMGEMVQNSLLSIEKFGFRFLTGTGRYVEDFSPPGQLHAVVVRAPHAHALIDGIDAGAARTMPGVRRIFTAADLDADGIGSLRCIAQVASGSSSVGVMKDWAEIGLPRIHDDAALMCLLIAGSTSSGVYYGSAKIVEK